MCARHKGEVESYVLSGLMNHFYSFTRRRYIRDRIKKHLLEDSPSHNKIFEIDRKNKIYSTN